MLRNRIFVVVAIALLPIAVAAGLALSTVNNSHRADVALLESAILTRSYQEVQGFVDGSILAQISIIMPHGQGLDVSTSAQKFALQNRLTAVPYLESLSFIDLNGREVTRLDRSHMDGFASSTLADMSKNQEFLSAVKGNYYVGSVAYGPDGPAASFASPFKDEGGNVLGVVMGTSSLASLQDIVGGVAIGNTGYLYLVDAKGLVIAGGGPFAEGSGLLPAAGTSSVEGLAIVQSALAGQDITGVDHQMNYAGVAGAPVVAAAKPLERYGWALVAEWPTAEANAVVNDLLRRNAIALGIVFILIALSSFVLAAHIVRPIKELQVAAARVAQGKFDRGVAVKTGDELEALGDSFNDMVQGLKQFEQLKDEFVFVAAHELRTPVAAMKGYLSLVLDGTAGAITPETKAYVEKVIASDNRLAQLVNDLLEVARSQAGRLTIKVAPTDIVAPVRAVLDELASLSAEKSVRMVYDPAPGLPSALADGERIKEVVVNLVGNAIKYMGGAGTITITHEVSNGMLVTSVADTGLGISEEAQKKLFEKFYRVQTEKTRDITGTGLGLFIVKQIIEKMNGSISVASAEGKGTTFSFALPLAGPGTAPAV